MFGDSEGGAKGGPFSGKKKESPGPVGRVVLMKIETGRKSCRDGESWGPGVPRWSVQLRYKLLSVPVVTGEKK